jgi:hypothetical protein
MPLSRRIFHQANLTKTILSRMDGTGEQKKAVPAICFHASAREPRRLATGDDLPERDRLPTARSLARTKTDAEQIGDGPFRSFADPMSPRCCGAMLSLGLSGTDAWSIRNCSSQFDCSGHIVGWEGVIAAGTLTLAIQA